MSPSYDISDKDFPFAFQQILIDDAMGMPLLEVFGVLAYYEDHPPQAPDAKEFRRLTRSIAPINGEVSYLQLGGELGDQGYALMVMGAGALLGCWQLCSPDTMLKDLIPAELKMEMAGRGMVTIAPLAQAA